MWDWARIPFLFSFFIISPAAAERFILFDERGAQVETYDAIVQRLRNGDRVVFSDGVEYSILGVLGNGNTTKILKIEGGKALRIPLKSGRFINEMGQEGPLYRDFINEFEMGWRSANANGVKIIHFYPYEYRAGERAVVDAIDVAFTLEDFLWKRNTLNLDTVSIEAVTKEVVEWFSSTFKYTYLGDFNESQVLFDLRTRKFILGDITGHNVDVVSFMIRNEIRHLPVENILVREDLTQAYPDKLDDQIFEAIETARRSWTGSSEMFCPLLLK